MDLLPTIAAAAGVALPEDRTFDGENLMPVLEGTGNRRGQDFFFFTGQKITGIRSGNWKLKIEPPSQAAGKKQDAALLFDLEQDIGESNDVANPQIVTELMKKADQFMQSLGAIPPAKK
jgi:arylsulfatase A-like enzyme